MTKMFFKNELKCSKRYGHVTDDVMSLFLSSKKLSGKTLFRCKFSLPFVETYHRPSTALGLVSRRFAHIHSPLRLLIWEVIWLLLTAPHKKNLKYAVCFQLDNEILSQQQNNLIWQKSRY